MFNDIGEKIKFLAKLIFFIEAIAAGIVGIYLLVNGELIGFAPLLLGPIVAWLSSFLLYGFGELISLHYEIAENTYLALTPEQAKKKEAETDPTHSQGY